MYVTIIVKLNSQKIEKFFITEQSFINFNNRPEKELYTAAENHENSSKRSTQRSVRLFLDGYCFSCIRNLLAKSPLYRSRVVDFCTKLSNGKIIVNLIEPQQHVMDYKWAKMIDTMVVERRELDDSFSWMSTLGGAYSALGDYIPNYAVIAGRISVHQLELALRLGDVPVVIRCCLYYALSLIQQGMLHQARLVIHTQYVKANQLPIEDTKLINICKGIWSILQYKWKLKKRKRKEQNQIL